MFENCGSLAELNAARIKAVSDGTPLVDVNNAYNARRHEILTSVRTYKTIQFTRIEKPKVQRIATLPIAGLSQEKGTISFTERGFLV